MANKKNILLSIDGGGVRGIIPVIILKEIEKLVGKPISENIDYFAGTSAGALIVANLALKDEELPLRKKAWEYLILNTIEVNLIINWKMFLKILSYLKPNSLFLSWLLI